MVPSTVDPFWYETYWYGVPDLRREHWHGVPRRKIRRHFRIDPAKLAAGLFFAVLLIGTALLVHFAPSIAADGLYFVT